MNLRGVRSVRIEELQQVPEMQRNELDVTEVDTGAVRHLESEAGLFKLDARFSLDALQPLAFELFVSGLRPFDDDVLYTDTVRALCSRSLLFFFSFFSFSFILYSIMTV